jgi:hypothetical protein
MPVQTQYSGQGPRLTVNMLIQDPLLIQARMLRMMDQQFLMDALLRQAPSATSGAVVYEESTPLFATDDASEVAEAGEIPLGMGQDGIPRVAHTVKTAMGITITREMRDRQRIDLVNRRMAQVRNTIVRNWERRLFKAFDGAAAATGSIVAGTQWSNPTGGNPRLDILAAIKLVTEARAQYANMDANNQQDYFGFVPDAIVISTTAMYNLLQNDKFVSLYLAGNIADRNPLYTGQLERTVLGCDVYTSRFMPPTSQYVLQTKDVGGYSDERPLGVSPLYGNGGGPNGGPTETWRADAVRRTAIFVDQPFAVAKIVTT